MQLGRKQQQQQENRHLAKGRTTFAIEVCVRWGN